VEDLKWMLGIDICVKRCGWAYGHSGRHVKKANAKPNNNSSTNKKIINTIGEIILFQSWSTICSIVTFR
jgi:RNase H-fold protein (predicted Holliday junction resolvase)